MILVSQLMPINWNRAALSNTNVKADFCEVVGNFFVIDKVENLDLG